MIGLGIGGKIATAGFLCLSTATGIYFYRSLIEKARWQSKHPTTEWTPEVKPAERLIVFLWMTLVTVVYVSVALKVCDIFNVFPATWESVLPWRW